MAFHKSNLGCYGEGLTADLDGYVPEATDTDPWAFRLDHGAEETHSPDGELTEYGLWWEEDGFPEWRAQAVRAAEEAAGALGEWQEANG